MKNLWYSFWFAPIDVRQYAALRILFGGLSGGYFLQLAPLLPEQLSRTGWLGSIMQIASHNGGSWSLFFLAPRQYPGLFAAMVMVIGMVSAFTLMIGWHSKLSAITTWLVWVSVWNRNPLILDGDDAVLKIMSFYLLLSPCGNTWSVDGVRKPLPQFAAIWPLRLVQFQVALIYFVSGWVKFHSTEWNEGTVLQYIVIHPQYSRWDGWGLIGSSFTRWLMGVIADVIRWWEVLFAILLLNPVTRKICISTGIVFHIGLLMTMNLRGFPLVMLSLYPSLLPNATFMELEQGLKKLVGKIQ
jgi:Vitamin K-dependent gamma-carboxylase